MKQNKVKTNHRKLVECTKSQRSNLQRLAFFDLTLARHSKKNERDRFLKILDIYIKDTDMQLKLLNTMRQAIKDGPSVTQEMMDEMKETVGRNTSDDSHDPNSTNLEQHGVIKT